MIENGLYTNGDIFVAKRDEHRSFYAKTLYDAEVLIRKGIIYIANPTRKVYYFH